MKPCKNLFGDVKIIFSDIDGTLINHEDKQLNPKTVKVFQELAAHGYPICLVTGRAFSDELKKILDTIGVIDYVSTCGGSFVTNLKTNETIITGNEISRPVLNWIINLAKVNQRALIVATSDGQVYNFYFGKNEKEDIQCSEYFNGGTTIDHFDDPARLDEIVANQTIVHLVYKAEPEKVLPFMPDAIEICKAYHDSCALVGNCFLEVEGRDVTKVSGIKYLLDQYGFSPNQAVYFGDSANDLPAFQLCKYAYQLGDNCDALTHYATKRLGNPKDSVIGDLLEQEILSHFN